MCKFRYIIYRRKIFVKLGTLGFFGLFSCGNLTINKVGLDSPDNYF